MHAFFSLVSPKHSSGGGYQPLSTLANELLGMEGQLHILSFALSP